MGFQEIADAAQALADEMTEGVFTVQAADLGLDPRAGYKLLVDDDRTYIAVHINEDRILQYYGGFEYVGKEYRLELGDLVFYSADNDRVAEHLDRLAATKAFKEAEHTAVEEEIARHD
jgi:hypothetical protein